MNSYRVRVPRVVARVTTPSRVPPVCAACDSRSTSPRADRSARSCWQAIRPFTPPLCDVCGDPLPSWRIISVECGQCPRCRRHAASHHAEPRDRRLRWPAPGHRARAQIRRTTFAGRPLAALLVAAWRLDACRRRLVVPVPSIDRGSERVGSTRPRKSRGICRSRRGRLETRRPPSRRPIFPPRSGTPMSGTPSRWDACRRRGPGRRAGG